jgi:hypothetical protein
MNYRMLTVKIIPGRMGNKQGNEHAKSESERIKKHTILGKLLYPLFSNFKKER